MYGVLFFGLDVVGQIGGPWMSPAPAPGEVMLTLIQMWVDAMRSKSDELDVFGQLEPQQKETDAVRAIATTLRQSRRLQPK